MTRPLYRLSDEDGTRLEPLLPKNRPGRPPPPESTTAG